MDLKLDLNGDLDVTDGDVTLLEGQDAIAQNIVTRLRTFLGEWFLDQRIGVPYFESILIKNADVRVIESILRRTITTTDGVDTVDNLTFDFDGVIRKLDVTAEITLLEGGTFTFEFEELILGD